MNTVQNLEIPLRKLSHVVGLCLALVLPAGLLTLASLGWLDNITFEIAFWSIALILVLYTLLVEQLPLSSLGFGTFRYKDVLWGVALGLLLLLVFPIASVIVKLIGFEVSQENAKALAGMPTYALFLLALRAAVTEEIIYRAYPVERLIALTGSKVLAAGVPITVFIISHFSWGMGHLVFVTLAGGLLTVFYLWKRNVWVNIIGHFLVDFAAFMLLPVLMKG